MFKPGDDRGNPYVVATELALVGVRGVRGARMIVCSPPMGANMTLLSALLYICVVGLSFAAFIGARYLAAAAFRVPGLLRPFGEAPALSYARARFGARPAIAVAGILGVYVVATALAIAGWL